MISEICLYYAIPKYARTFLGDSSELPDQCLAAFFGVAQFIHAEIGSSELLESGPTLQLEHKRPRMSFFPSFMT